MWLHPARSGHRCDFVCGYVYYTRVCVRVRVSVRVHVLEGVRVHVCMRLRMGMRAYAEAHAHAMCICTRKVHVYFVQRTINICLRLL